MGVKEWLYEDCPCGSGKKLKFCCWPAVRGEVPEGSGHDRLVEAVRNSRQPEGLSNNWGSLRDFDALRAAAMGLQEMREARYKEAAEGFRKARKAMPGLYAAWNNEAMATWMAGNRDKARRLLEEGLEMSGSVNAFGWGLLSGMRHASGDEAGAEEAAWRAAAIVPMTRDAASKTATALALLGKDEELLRYVSGCGFEWAGAANFHAAVAAANLGRREEALEWLDRIGDVDFPVPEELWGGLAEDLEEGLLPEDLPEGRWTHWNRHFYDPGQDVQVEAMASFAPEWSAVLCDMISMALYGESLSPGDALELLRFLEGPCAEALRGRLAARGAAEAPEPKFASREEARNFFIDAVFHLEGMSYESIEFIEDVPDEDPVADEDMEAYAKALDVLKKGDPRHPGLAEARATLERLAEGHPKRHRAWLNLAGLMYLSGEKREAVEILERLFDEHPDYGFAAAALLRLAVRDGDLARGAEICRQYRPAKAMPPTEYLDWLDAQEFFLTASGKDEAAANVRKIARQVRKETGIPEPEPSLEEIREALRRKFGLGRRRRRK